MHGLLDQCVPPLEPFEQAGHAPLVAAMIIKCVRVVGAGDQLPIPAVYTACVSLQRMTDLFPLKQFMDGLLHG